MVIDKKIFSVYLLFLNLFFGSVFAEENVSYPQAILSGDGALFAKDYGKAKDDYELAAQKKPGEALPHIKLGNLYYEQFHFMAALAEFEKAFTLHADSFSKKFLSGAIQKIKQNQTLLGQIEAITTQGSGNTVLLVPLHAQAVLKLQEGGAYMMLLSPHMEYLLSVDPNNTSILKALAEGHYLAQNLPKAAKYYERLARFLPHDAALERRTADTFAAIGDLGRASLYYRKALRETLRASAHDRARRKAAQRSIREIKELIHSLPKSEAYIWEWIQNEEYEKAASELKRYLSKNPADIWAMTTMGALFEEMDENAQAERIYKKAMKINPDHPLPYFYWGRYLLLKKKEFWEALQAFEKYRTKLKENAALVDDPERKKRVTEHAAQAARYVASIYMETLNKPQFAVQALEEAVKESPKDAEIYYDLGVAYVRVKKRISAIQTFRKVIELKPDSKLAKDAEIAINQTRSMTDEI